MNESGSRPGGTTGILRRLRLYADMVMFGHTLFSLPFGLAAMLMATGGRPGWRNTVWVVAALVGARTAANALNRLIDRQIDARNPRTADRHLPAGAVRRREAVGVTVVGGLLLLVAALNLHPICIRLLPIPIVLFFLYSYSKRFTWLCHMILGAACAGASFGAWLAVTGEAPWPLFVLATANAAWVTGFDLIYATLDVEFDRKEGLHSIPAAFGITPALVFSALCHGVMAVLLVYTGLLLDLGYAYYVGVAAVTVLLIVEHFLVVPGDAVRIPLAAYRLNQIIGLVFFAGTAAHYLLVLLKVSM